MAAQRRSGRVNWAARAERASGVDRYVILGVWGLETDFGNHTGDAYVIRSLATLAEAPRRGVAALGQKRAGGSRVAHPERRNRQVKRAAKAERAGWLTVARPAGRPNAPEAWRLRVGGVIFGSDVV